MRLHGANARSSCDQLMAELVQLVNTITQAVIIGDIVEELLSIQGSAEEQCQVPVRGFDDKRDFVLLKQNKIK